MRILIVTPFYEPDLGPSAPLISMLSEDLAAMDYKITVLAAVPHFPSGFVQPEYRKHIWKWDRSGRVQICRIRVPSGKRGNLWHRLSTFIFYQILACFVGLNLSYDAVLITNPALETGLPMVLLSVLRRKPSVFCVWDLYPEVGITLGIFRRPSIIYLVKSLEDFCLRRATAVQTLSDSFVAILRQRVHPDTQIEVIPPWIDTNFIAPLPRINRFSTAHGLNECFVVLYAGNLGLSQGLEKVLLAAKELSCQRKNIRFLFVGDGPNKRNLVAQADSLQLDNVRFIPFQAREHLPEVLATADLSLVSLQPGISTGSLPSKTFPILASGRPILAVAEEESELCRLIQLSRAGKCVSPFNCDSLSREIIHFQEDYEMCERMGRNARNFSIRHYSRNSAAQHYKRILERIISQCQRTTLNGQ